MALNSKFARRVAFGRDDVPRGRGDRGEFGGRYQFLVSSLQSAVWGWRARFHARRGKSGHSCGVCTCAILLERGWRAFLGVRRLVERPRGSGAGRLLGAEVSARGDHAKPNRLALKLPVADVAGATPQGWSQLRRGLAWLLIVIVSACGPKLESQSGACACPDVTIKRVSWDGEMCIIDVEAIGAIDGHGVQLDSYFGVASASLQIDEHGHWRFEDAMRCGNDPQSPIEIVAGQVLNLNVPTYARGRVRVGVVHRSGDKGTWHWVWSSPFQL